MKLSTGGGGNFTPAPEGIHQARIYSIIDLGDQTSPNFGTKRQMVVQFELVGTDMGDGKPFTMNNWYTPSLHPKANLLKDIEAMFGKSMPDSKKTDFDIQSLLNRPCKLTVVHKVKDGDTKANIAAVGLAVGEVAELANPLQYFDTEAPNWDVYENLSDYFKKTINMPANQHTPPAAPAEQPAAQQNEAPAGDGIDWD